MSLKDMSVKQSSNANILRFLPTHGDGRHLGTADRFAELAFPLLSIERPGNVTQLRANTGPFGETIANERRPLVKTSQS